MANKNDEAWEQFFDDHDTLSFLQDYDVTYITADDMKNYREPRLMAKIDTKELLPEIFRENELSILPVKNGEYIIFKDPDNKSFFKFPKNSDDINIEQHQPAVLLSNFDSFTNLDNLYESQALDVAFMTSLIKTFTEENELWLTIRGRHFTNNFSVFIPSIQRYIEICKVQVEIDAGYESENAIYLFEAKIGKRENFNIRQLLFPYLEWKQRTQKPVIPIFFFFTNGFYYFYQFDLGDSLDASNIVKQACYTVSEIEKLDLKNLLADTKLCVSQTDGIPFPQSDDLDKVIDVISLVAQGFETKIDISEALEFDERQGDYYANAARFLGFLERSRTCYRVTNKGNILLQLDSPIKRAKLLITHLLERPVFRDLLIFVIENDLDFDLINEINIPLLINKYYDLSDETLDRRSSTVKQWMMWVSRYV